MKGLTLIVFMGVVLGCSPETKQSDPIRNRSQNGANDQSAKTSEQDDSKNEPDDADTSGDESKDNTVTRRVYPIEGERPAEICGQAGFEYLARGYFFEECGGCHYEGNRFGVTNFAMRNDLDASYQVLLNQVDKETLVEASIENAFCNSCLLAEDDPLLADIRYFASHTSDSQCETP